ncbi:MAG: hypothetical protein MUF64_25020 [Polyangiaceae bacterium]|nr:hypothetical protein [Polyangiaceae bacterium]
MPATSLPPRLVVASGLAVAALGLLACNESPPAPAPAAPSASARPRVAPAASASIKPAMAPPASASAPRVHPEICEVEFFGQVGPVDPKKPAPVVFASYGDCLAPGAGNIGQTSPEPNGKFFLEVFVKWGSDLTLCSYQPAAPGSDKPTKLYGKAAGPFHAESEGEVEFKNVQIEMKEGPPKTFAKVKPGGGL